MNQRTTNTLKPPVSYSAYQLYCPKCGYKQAEWTVDPPWTQAIEDNAFRQQIEQVTKPTHDPHGEWKFVAQLRHGTKAQLAEFDQSARRASGIET